MWSERAKPNSRHPNLAQDANSWHQRLNRPGRNFTASPKQSRCSLPGKPEQRRLHLLYLSPQSLWHNRWHIPTNLSQTTRHGVRTPPDTSLHKTARPPCSTFPMMSCRCSTMSSTTARHQTGNNLPTWRLPCSWGWRHLTAFQPAVAEEAQADGNRI